MTLIDGPTPDPDDQLMEHHFYYGYIPKDLSPSTGLSRTHTQVRVDDPDSPAGYRMKWVRR